MRLLPQHNVHAFHFLQETALRAKALRATEPALSHICECCAGYGDGASGFYAVYEEVFRKLWEQEQKVGSTSYTVPCAPAARACSSGTPAGGEACGRAAGMFEALRCSEALC